MRSAVCLLVLLFLPWPAFAGCGEFSDQKGGFFLEPPSKGFCERGPIGEVYRTVGHPSEGLPMARTRNGKMIEALFFTPFSWPTRDGKTDWLYVALDEATYDELQKVPEDVPVAVRWQLHGEGASGNARTQGCCIRVRRAIDVEVLR